MRPSTITAGVCALLALTLGLVVAGGHSPRGIDDAAWSAVAGWPHRVLDILVLPTEPYVIVPAIALVAVYRWRDAPFVVLAPVLAVAVNTWVLKPLFDRWKGDTLVYPSGHTVGLVATLVVVLVLSRKRTIIAVVGGVLLVAAGIGMVGLGYHYVTDVVGGTFFAVSAVLAISGLWRRSGSGAECRWFVLSRSRWRG